MCPNSKNFIYLIIHNIITRRFFYLPSYRLNRGEKLNLKKAMVVLLLLLVAVSVTCVSAEDIASDSSGNGDGSGISGEGTFGDSQDGTTTQMENQYNATGNNSTGNSTNNNTNNLTNKTNVTKNATHNNTNKTNKNPFGMLATGNPILILIIVIVVVLVAYVIYSKRK